LAFTEASRQDFLIGPGTGSDIPLTVVFGDPISRRYGVLKILDGGGGFGSVLQGKGMITASTSIVKWKSQSFLDYFIAR
jgi:hypothetical protein